ncbi:hypothetical protein FI146_970019 [Flavobacterium psychrophilum]|nr:hypothetical protein FI146_970019 [Flavobacterium psychrophilum]
MSIKNELYFVNLVKNLVSLVFKKNENEKHNFISYFIFFCSNILTEKRFRFATS